jgi:hypothetical protein
MPLPFEIIILVYLHAPFIHGKPSLYKIWRLTHHGEDLSSDPLKKGSLRYLREKIFLKDFREEISLKDFKEEIFQPSMRSSTFPKK